MRRVGILLKPGKPEAIDIAAELVPWLGKRGHEALIAGAETAVPGARKIEEAQLGEEVDLLVILGGDGTLLRGAALVAERGVPILGINLGHLGFLTSCAPIDATTAVERALAGELPLEERLRLRCVLKRETGEETVKYACNDAVVS